MVLGKVSTIRGHHQQHTKHLKPSATPLHKGVGAFLLCTDIALLTEYVIIKAINYTEVLSIEKDFNCNSRYYDDAYINCL